MEAAGQVGSHLHHHQEHLLVDRGGSRQGGGRPSSCGGSPRCGGEVVPCVGGRRRAPEGGETLGEAARGKKEVLRRKHLKKVNSQQLEDLINARVSCFFLYHNHDNIQKRASYC